MRSQNLVLEGDSVPKVSPQLLSLLLLSFWSPALPGSETSNETVKRCERAVVTITTYDHRGKRLLQGSGFFIALDRVVTNSHVIRGSRRIQVKTSAGTSIDVENILAINDKSDLAILGIAAPQTSHNIFQVEEAPPAEGESIILISNPQEGHLKTSRGTITQIWDFNDVGKRIEMTAAVKPGGSGSPVVNEQGRVIGIAVMHVQAGDKLNFAVPSESLRELQASIGL